MAALIALLAAIETRFWSARILIHVIVLILFDLFGHGEVGEFDCGLSVGCGASVLG